MIRIVMLGRLGNNLFQYALGRTLAEKYNTRLIMDASWFNEEGWSQVECIRRLPGPAAGKAEIIRPFSIGSRVLRKLSGKHYWEYLRVPVLKENEKDQSFDPRFLSAPEDCMLFGYFQTPLYFGAIEDQLRKELSTADLGLEKGHEKLAADLRHPGSVAIHIRRTDYTGNPNLDLCGREYYQSAMQEIRSSVGETRFHIFSDDPSWSETNLTGTDIAVVSHAKAVSPLTDLHLMSLASHHIIANSSYSWWAAWLGKKEGQKVITPGRWFSEINVPIDEKLSAGWQIQGRHAPVPGGSQ